MSWSVRIASALQQRKAQAALRYRVAHQASDARWITVAARRYLNFASNDYLGLTHHPQVIAAWQRGAAMYGTGAGASNHVVGHSVPHQQLEETLASWLGYPRALLFTSGFAANQAVIHALMRKGDRIVADKLSHASLVEAASHSAASLRRFKHNDPCALAVRLNTTCAGETLVITEGIFSMDGDTAPLAQINTLTDAAHGWLLVDDAHGIGVVGEQGRGSCWQAAIQPALQIITFGKAFGVGGAAVLCGEATADYLLQFARHLIYSTALPPAQALAVQAALQQIQHGAALREQLQHNIRQFRRQAGALPWTLLPSASAIQPLVVGDNATAIALAQRLRQAGCWVVAIRPPTVPVGGARLRITLTAAHQAHDIATLLEILHAAAKE